MDIKVLLSFKKVAELENISQASEQLGYAQSTVTTQIRQLESELDVKLFDRLGNRIHLTESGARFLAYTEEIISLMARAKENLTNHSFPQGTLRIAGIHSLCASILPQIIKEYAKQYPAVKIEVVTGSVGEVLEQVRKGDSDIAFYMDFAEAKDDFVVAYRKKNPLLFLCGCDSKFCNRNNLKLEDLATEPFIATEKGCCYRKKMEQLFFDRQLAPNVYFETGNTEIVKKFVENDIGIAILPEVAVRTEMLERKLVKLNLNEAIPEATIRLIYHKNKWLTPAMKTFVDVVQSTC